MKYLADILGIEEQRLRDMDREMVLAQKPSLEDGFEKAFQERNKKTCALLGLADDASGDEVRNALNEQVRLSERELYDMVGTSPSSFDFHKVASYMSGISTETEGFFLKKEYGARILKERPPEATLAYLGYKTTEELLEKEDIGEVFSALRFIESTEWMHETFQVAYTKFGPDDFERRPIEIRVLGPQWEEVAKAYVAKKHHNVSHLKEFGVIFVNPIAATEEGKFLRDAALLLHYFHEIAFYSRLFEKAMQGEKFQERFISLLRGDVLDQNPASDRDWLIVQRYLWKENPEDLRLRLPRVNPEAMHWKKAEEDLVGAGVRSNAKHIAFWNNLSSAAIFVDGRVVSLDMEDAAMSFVGGQQEFSYHQKEALWNEICAWYVGGYEKLQEKIENSMEQGIISL